MEVKSEVHSWETRRGDGVEIFKFFPDTADLVCLSRPIGKFTILHFHFFIYFYSKHFVSYFCSHTVPLIFSPFWPFWSFFSLFYYFSINYSAIQIFWYQNPLKTGVKCYRGPEFSFLEIFYPFEPFFIYFLLLFLKLNMNKKILILRPSKSVENWGQNRGINFWPSYSPIF